MTKGWVADIASSGTLQLLDKVVSNSLSIVSDNNIPEFIIKT